VIPCTRWSGASSTGCSRPTDPLTGFVPVQRRLDRGEALSRVIRHEAGALSAVPGGPAEGRYPGQRLFES